MNDMDPELIATRLGRQVREKRLNRGHTQASLAALSRLPRQKIIAIEQGSLTVSLAAYARALAALECELNVVPARYPTLEDVQGLFD